jgi:hypothetical protein
MIGVGGIVVVMALLVAWVIFFWARVLGLDRPARYGRGNHAWIPRGADSLRAKIPPPVALRSWERLRKAVHQDERGYYLVGRRR